MSIKKQTIIFIIIIVPIIILLRIYWINNELNIYISSGSFRKDTEELGKYTYMKKQEILSGKYDNLYYLRKDLIKEGIIKGHDIYIYKKSFGDFKIEKKGNDCYIYNLNITELLKNNINFTSFKGFVMKDNNNKLTCSSGDMCNIYLTEKGLLNINDNYSCK